MSNYIDYIGWLGEFDMNARPFGECDAMILCQLSYLDLRGILEPGSVMTLSECAAELERRGRQPVLRLLSDPALYVDFVKLAAESVRFGSLEMSAYTDISSDGGDEDTAGEDVQFSAVTFRIGEDALFIAFRGTDDTIAGWKEDFMMSFTETKAQKLALGYLTGQGNKAAEIYIVGHSKGGNLALYACALAGDDTASRIKHIYILDGPGLCSDIVDTERMDRIKGRTTCIVPEYSVVGKLFAPDVDDTRIVCSEADGILQHDIMNWEIEYGRPKYAEKNSPRSVFLNSVLDRWIEGMPQEKRKNFVDELFGALSKSGDRSFSDITAKGAYGFEATLVNMAQVSDSVKRDALEIPIQMIYGDIAKELKKNDPSVWLGKKGILKYISIILFGILMLIVPRNIEEWLVIALFSGVTLFQTAVTVRNLYISHWNAENEQFRIYLCIAMMTALFAVIVKENALFVIGSLLFGAGFLAEAFHRGRMFLNTRKGVFEKVMTGTETVLAAASGISYLVIPESSIYVYALGIGIFLIADGAIRLVHGTVKAIIKKIR